MGVYVSWQPCLLTTRRNANPEFHTIGAHTCLGSPIFRHQSHARWLCSSRGPVVLLMIHPFHATATDEVISSSLPAAAAPTSRQEGCQFAANSLACEFYLVLAPTFLSLLTC